jgi:hypothetical protein
VQIRNCVVIALEVATGKVTDSLRRDLVDDELQLKPIALELVIERHCAGDPWCYSREELPVRIACRSKKPCNRFFAGVRHRAVPPLNRRPVDSLYPGPWGQERKIAGRAGAQVMGRGRPGAGLISPCPHHKLSLLFILLTRLPRETSNGEGGRTDESGSPCGWFFSQKENTGGGQR